VDDPCVFDSYLDIDIDNDVAEPDDQSMSNLITSKIINDESAAALKQSIVSTMESEIDNFEKILYE